MHALTTWPMITSWSPILAGRFPFHLQPPQNEMSMNTCSNKGLPDIGFLALAYSCVYLTVNQTLNVNRTYSQTEMACFYNYTINNAQVPWVFWLQEALALISGAYSYPIMKMHVCKWASPWSFLLTFMNPCSSCFSIPWSPYSCVACMNQTNVKTSIARQSACQQICQNPLLIFNGWFSSTKFAVTVPLKHTFKAWSRGPKPIIHNCPSNCPPINHHCHAWYAATQGDQCSTCLQSTTNTTYSYCQTWWVSRKLCQGV